MTCTQTFTADVATVQTLADCFVGTLFGLDWTIAAFVSLAVIASLAYWFRIPSVVSMGLGFAWLYMFDLIAGGSNILQFGMAILALGFAVNLFIGMISYVKEYSQ